MDILLKGGTVVSSYGCRKADILVSGEKIAEIGDNLSADNRQVIDVSGKLLFPGFIDAHTHFDLETSVFTADNFETGSKAALCGGTTTVVDFSTQNRGETLAQALKNWHDKADGKTSCDYAFHMSVSEWNEKTEKEMDDMITEGITSFKLYMAYDNLRVSDAEMYEILKKVKELHGIVGTHCENGDLVNELIKDELAAGHTEPKYHPVSRPPIVEAEAIKRYLAVAELADVPVNIVHLSSEEGYKEVVRARENGQKVYVETCPQYLVLDDSSLETGVAGDLPPDTDKFAGAKFVFSPPMRKKSDSECLWQAIAEDKIDTISTDHCSFNYKGDKELGRSAFNKIPNGIPGVEHRPVIIYSYGVKQGRITVEQMCKLLSENIAKLFGMYPKKGVLAVGSDADIVVWSPDEQWTISKENQHHNCDYTPYEGMRVTGRAKDVFLRGTQVVKDGEIVKEKIGKYVYRNESIYF